MLENMVKYECFVNIKPEGGSLKMPAHIFVLDWYSFVPGPLKCLNHSERKLEAKLLAD